MSEWKEYRLGDLCTISSSKRIFAKEYQSTGIPFYRGKEIIEKHSGNRISNELYIPLERYNEIKNKYGVPQEGDMLLTSVGTLGVPYIVRDEEFYFKDGNLTWFYNFQGLNNYFLYYWFVSPVACFLIDTKSIGSTQKALTIETLKKFEISLPPLDTQRRIASILSSLDDKIAVNKKICENLEAQAQALFKHWFVDFAPFKEGKFVESELGSIPEGWRVGRLGEIAEFKRGKTITKSDVKEGSVPVVAGGLEPAYYHNQSNTSSRVITISGSGANAGFTRMYYQPVWASDCSYVDNDTTSFLHIAYCYLLTNKKKVDALQWGAAQPHVYAKDVNKLPLVIAPLDVLNQFEEKISKMFDLIEVKNKEITRLSTLRDTLLPKLMSGEIKVGDVTL